MDEKKGDKVFIEKEERIRLIIDNQIGLGRVLGQLKEKFKVSIFNNKSEDEKILLIEEDE